MCTLDKSTVRGLKDAVTDLGLPDEVVQKMGGHFSDMQALKRKSHGTAMTSTKIISKATQMKVFN